MPEQFVVTDGQTQYAVDLATQAELDAAQTPLQEDLANLGDLVAGLSAEAVKATVGGSADTLRRPDCLVWIVVGGVEPDGMRTTDIFVPTTPVTTVWRDVHSFAVDAPTVKQYPGLFVALGANTTCKLVKARCKTDAGTATVDIFKNGSAAAGFGSISVTSTAASTTPTSVTLAEDDQIALNASAVSGASRLTVTAVFEYTYTPPA